MLGYKDLKTKQLITVEKIENIKTVIQENQTTYIKVTDDIRIHKKKFDINTGEQIDDEVIHYTRQELEDQQKALSQAVALKADIDAILADMPAPIQVTEEEVNG